MENAYEGLGRLTCSMQCIQDSVVAGAQKTLARELAGLIETAAEMRQRFGAETCSECKGEGWVTFSRCKCNGTGQMPIGGWTK